MLTYEDHRQLAERCIRLAKECTKPSVAEYLMTLAANYLELAERALILREPAPAVRRQHIKAVQRVDRPRAPVDSANFPARLGCGSRTLVMKAADSFLDAPIRSQGTNQARRGSKRRCVKGSR
jgi:hypothetical protein